MRTIDTNRFAQWHGAGISLRMVARLTTAVLSAGVLGCAIERDLGGNEAVFARDGSGYPQDVEGMPAGLAADSNLAVSQAVLGGRLGAVGVAHGSAAEGAAYDEDRYSAVYSFASAQNDLAAMTVVEFLGGINDAAFAPGMKKTYFADDDVLEEPVVAVIGCSGPDPSAWEWDSYADRVDVEISETGEPGTVLVDYTAEFFEGNGTKVNGSFVVER